MPQFEKIETLLDKIDVKKPQILIEAFIVEAKPNLRED